VGNPPNVNDTSNLALFVLEQRHRRPPPGLPPGPPPYALCCGAAPVAMLWRPRRNHRFCVGPTGARIL
jgi:hypothetical protein